LRASAGFAVLGGADLVADEAVNRHDWEWAIIYAVLIVVMILCILWVANW
jgi:hypothetical protein